MRSYVYYTFPTWLLNMAVFVKLQFQGPEILLRCLHIREFQTTQSFQSLAQGQIEHVKTLIMTGQASILDVYELGESLLQVIPRLDLVPR